MTNLVKIFPLGVLGLGVLYLASIMIPRGDKAGDYNFADYRAIPVLDGGRYKPIDTVARINLMIISGKQTFIDNKDQRQPAIKWLLDVMSAWDEKAKAFEGPAMDHKVFRIDNEEVLDVLKLKPRKGFRYAINEFREQIKEVMDHAERARETDAKKRGLFDVKVLELADHLALFQQLALRNIPRSVMPTFGDKAEWLPLADFLPPNAPVEQLQSNHAALAHYLLLYTYREGKADQFNKLLEKTQDIFAKQLPAGNNTTHFEVFFNRVEPFHHASVLYVFAFLLGCISWLAWAFRSGWFVPFHNAGYWLMALAFVVHTWALLARMYIQDRPLVVVTNLYSSAVFIGWGCVAIGLFIEFFYRYSIATVVSSALAAITAGIIAHYLSLSGDTMEMMQAVLDTNFWLATHVTCVTLGYTATFVAGFLGICYIFLGLLTPLLRKDWSTILNKMTYGVVCFAMLLSFTGTVLGGIWADQSWGRFWGWDPKENGALLIVIWNALILHSRWAGLIKQRGLAVLTVGGNIVTAWSWFGTNMLGVGLHSYGFMPAAVTWMIVFVITQLTIITMGLIPLKYWMSFRTMPVMPLASSGDRPARLPGAPKTAITTSS